MYWEYVRELKNYQNQNENPLIIETKTKQKVVFVLQLMAQYLVFPPRTEITARIRWGMVLMSHLRFS